MKKRSLTLIAILMVLSFCRNVSSGNQPKADCNKINSQAMDSLILYKTSFDKRKSTLESTLRLLDDAIKCDSSLNIAKFNKVTVLNELGKFNESISLINKLIRSQKDSSLLLTKAPIYDKINKHDSLTITYKLAYNYFDRRIKDRPGDANIIFGKLFSQSKIYGKESVISEIDYYLKKYPDDVNLKALLTQILQP